MAIDANARAKAIVDEYNREFAQHCEHQRSRGWECDMAFLARVQNHMNLRLIQGIEQAIEDAQRVDWPKGKRRLLTEAE